MAKSINTKEFETHKRNYDFLMRRIEAKKSRDNGEWKQLIQDYRVNTLDSKKPRMRQ